MLNRLGYWLRETLASLRRNLTLTVAAVLTAAVSLLLLGVALLARQGVGNQLVQWKGGVQAGKVTDSFRNLYPLPATELIANPNLKQNTGY